MSPVRSGADLILRIKKPASNRTEGSRLGAYFAKPSFAHLDGGDIVLQSRPSHVVRFLCAHGQGCTGSLFARAAWNPGAARRRSSAGAPASESWTRNTMALAYAWRAAAPTAIVLLTASAIAQQPQTLAPEHASGAFRTSQAFTFLFLAMGPIPLIPAFAALTAGRDRVFKRRLALSGVGVAAIGIVVAAMTGVF
jgi:hypothetical protein